MRKTEANNNHILSIVLIVAICFIPTGLPVAFAAGNIFGRVVSTDKSNVDFATVYVKELNTGCSTDEEGKFQIDAPAGRYTLVVSAVGFKTAERTVVVKKDEGTKQIIVLEPSITELDEVVVTSDGVSRLQQSSFNVVALDTKSLSNTSKSLSDALSKAPGIKLRESGGVGSDMTMQLDGFSGKHVKIFIDGVPQEGVGESFSLNNIPVNYAERIEVYRGVVPVEFGTDAIGGVINIVTKKHHKDWQLEASYSYGSFNTHKSYVNFTYTSEKGLLFELNAFQNYSDNSYWVETQVEEFDYENGTTRIPRTEERVRRFNDTYHNEAVIAKIGVVDKKWADRLVLSFTYSNMYKEIQTGVVQKVVFGQKHRKGYSLMPSLEYVKRDLFTPRLDLTFTANYNNNITQNIDTSSVRYNWLGQTWYMDGRLGEQAYQDRRMDNDNYNATLSLRYHIGTAHHFLLNHVFNLFRRANSSTAGTVTSEADDFVKLTCKNITGLSYTLTLSEIWNLSAFGKYYNQYNSGPVSTSESGTTDYILLTQATNAFGGGVTGTVFFLKGAQAKLSYEHAYRLPTNDELFGDEDLELGSMVLKPERSENVNLNLSYSGNWKKHGLYVEGAFIFRDTKDYIQRMIGTYTGNKSYASYQNHGKVRTLGYTLSARYNYANWVSLGCNFTQMDVRDNEKTLNEGSEQVNLTYGDRLPNQPYLFADADITFFWNHGKGNQLSVTYDNYWQHEFPLYSESLGSKDSKSYVPEQLSHNIGIAYSLRNGQYNFSFECRNLTDAKLYDNFSLQRAGRAFYGKVRVLFGTNVKKGGHNGHHGGGHRGGGHGH